MRVDVFGLMLLLALAFAPEAEADIVFGGDPILVTPPEVSSGPATIIDYTPPTLIATASGFTVGGMSYTVKATGAGSIITHWLVTRAFTIDPEGIVRVRISGNTEVNESGSGTVREFLVDGSVDFANPPPAFFQRKDLTGNNPLNWNKSAVLPGGAIKGSYVLVSESRVSFHATAQDDQVIVTSSYGTEGTLEPDVPALSEWRIVVFALLLFVVGTATLARRFPGIPVRRGEQQQDAFRGLPAGN